MPIRPGMRPGRTVLLVSTSALALSVVVAPVRLDQDILVPVVNVAAAEPGDTRDGVSELEVLAAQLVIRDLPDSTPHEPKAVALSAAEGD